jgi:membrane associated rhomboid family serine protease
MGMSSRNYGYRFRFGGGGGSMITPAVKTLLITMTAVFLGQTAVALTYHQDGSNWVYEHFGLVPGLAVFYAYIWQPFTYIFLHGGLWHLLINMLVLWMFGCDLERVWGQRKFYTYFFTCGVGAGLIVIVAELLPMAWHHMPSGIPTVGASGAIYGVLVACAVLFPDRQIWLIPFPVTLSMRVYVSIMVAIEFFSELTSGTGDNVSHVCHLGGIVIGYLYLRRGSFFYNMRNSVSDWKQRRLRRKFKVYMQQRGGDPPSRPDRWVN